MQCLCGYDFAKHTLATPCPFASYAVVADKDYAKFLRLEMEVLAAKSGKQKIRAVGRSAGHVGSLLHCPKWGRYTLVHAEAPGAKITLAEEADEDWPTHT